MKRRTLLKSSPLLVVGALLPATVSAAEPSMRVTITLTPREGVDPYYVWDHYAEHFDPDTKMEFCFYGGDLEGIIVKEKAYQGLDNANVAAVHKAILEEGRRRPLAKVAADWKFDYVIITGLVSQQEYQRLRASELVAESGLMIR